MAIVVRWHSHMLSTQESTQGWIKSISFPLWHCWPQLKLRTLRGAQEIWNMVRLNKMASVSAPELQENLCYDWLFWDKGKDIESQAQHGISFACEFSTIFFSMGLFTTYSSPQPSTPHFRSPFLSIHVILCLSACINSTNLCQLILVGVHLCLNQHCLCIYNYFYATRRKGWGNILAHPEMCSFWALS